jgi:uncharacterized protein YbjQ (UPF0145 family)
MIELTVFVVLLLIGLFFGRANEQRHYRELSVIEDALRDIVVCSGRGPADDGGIRRAALVVGSVVIAEDYFKRVAASIKSLFGGHIVAYESLLERGRREAIVRMKEEARQLGATQVVNVRLETASLSEDFSGQRPMFSAEFIAYGTALVPEIEAERRRTLRT